MAAQIVAAQIVATQMMTTQITATTVAQEESRYYGLFATRMMPSEMRYLQRRNFSPLVDFLDGLHRFLLTATDLQWPS
jgi:hypothetical protein